MIRVSATIFLLFLALALVSCGSGEYSTREFGSSYLRGAKLRQLGEANSARIQWFPVDEASAYVLVVTGENGEELFHDAIAPYGCTHRGIEGFTSGLCYFDVPLFGSAVFQLSAVNALGESPQSVAFLD